MQPADPFDFKFTPIPLSKTTLETDERNFFNTKVADGHGIRTNAVQTFH